MNSHNVGAGDPMRPGDPANDALATHYLLDRINSGDGRARDVLVRRHLPALLRWAHGRLPRGARDVMDTHDLVQVTFVRALDHIEGFEVRSPGAFFAYLRRILMNQVRDEIRKTNRRPSRDELSDQTPTDRPSPLEETLGQDLLESYEQALATLPEEYQQAVFLRVELGFTYQEIADVLDKPTMNAARMLVSRAMLKLAEVLHDRGIESAD
jgi:RNA polymerase sigma-70 factor (ECF subfamily)